MMSSIGACPVCQTQKITLTKHHVVEAPDENGKAYTINLCKSCHDTHEKYRNYLKNVCGIDIDKTKSK
jgi:hypothetical protein